MCKYEDDKLGFKLGVFAQYIESTKYDTANKL